MRIDVVTLFPQMIEEYSQWGVIGRAVQRGILQLKCWNPRVYTKDKHRTVDDRPYGGGPGMVMRFEPLRDAIFSAKASSGTCNPVIYLSPHGARFDQNKVNQITHLNGLILVAGRYEGIDQRIIDTVIDEEWSIGDYVLSGGELAAMVVIDAVSRVVPGVLGHDESALQDSFATGLLDYPHYTRPEEIEGKRVPEVLLSGDHQAIDRWRKKNALGLTWLKRPDLLEMKELDKEQRLLLEEFIEEWRERTLTKKLSDA